MQAWQTLFLKTMSGNHIDRELLSYVDELLAWLANFSDQAHDQMTRMLFAQHSAQQVHLRLYTVLDNLLFIEGDGFFGVGDDAEQVKRRYRRLMQVYHPDRSTMNATWMNKRAEQINTAYAHRKRNNFRSTPNQLTAFTASPVRPTSDQSFAANKDAFFSFNLRKTQLTGAALRKRVLLSLALLSLLLLCLVYWDNTRLDLSLSNASIVDLEPSSPQTNSQKVSFAAITATTSNSLATTVPLNESAVKSVHPTKVNQASAETNARVTLTSTQKQEIEYFIDDWTHAWVGQDLSRYLSFYAKEFSPMTGLSSEQWLIDRRLALTNKDFIRVKIYDMEIKPYKSGVEVQFLQYYFSDVLVDKVHKTLYLKKQANGWKITKELAKPV